MTTEQYIQQFDLNLKKKLNELTELLRQLMPGCDETFAYQMPTFRVKKNIIHFAVQKNHIGIYSGPEAIAFFETSLAHYKHAKGSFQVPFDQVLPIELIKDMVNFNLNILRKS